MRVQVDAQYFAYEASLKDYEEESDTIYISPPENDAAILAEYQKLSDMLGFDTLLYDSDDDIPTQQDEYDDTTAEDTQPALSEDEASDK